MNGKGSKPRPLSVSREVYEKNWDMLFGKKDKKEWKENQKDGSGKEKEENKS